jgi:hypothetical protein
MPCNGFNHPATCECGWGGVWHGNLPTSRVWNDGNTRLDATGLPVEAVSIDREVRTRKPESLTIPNARCPVCGASVFFYQNEYGSRVFFDSLGFDWPKHPCTDNSRYSPSIRDRIYAPKAVIAHRSTTLEEGSRPFLILLKQHDHAILASFHDDEYLRLDLEVDFLCNAFPVVFIKELTDDFASVSYFHAGVHSGMKRNAPFRRLPATQIPER